jgi:PKD repeat protein
MVGRKMKSKSIFAALVLICLVGLISVVSAAQVTKIGDGRDPAIDGTKVVWADLSGVIHLYDLSTKKDTKISSSSASHPDIQGNKMVWFDKGTGVPRITVYDIPSGSKTFLTQDVDDRSIPHIYGNYLVWTANYGVYLRYMSPDKNVKSWQTRIGNGCDPDIYNTKVVYCADGSDTADIAVYDISSKKIKIVSPYETYAGHSHIYGNKVIWSDFRTRYGYIDLVDIATNEFKEITSDTAGNTLIPGAEAGCDTGTHTSIYGDKIVYCKNVDDQFGYAGVYVYSISTQQNFQIANYPADTFTTPEIYGNNVVWGFGTDFSVTDSADTGIYVYNLGSKPTADFSANKVSGKAPLYVKFTSKTTGNPNYYWVFEKSIEANDWNSQDANPDHYYNEPGKYTVSLTVTNAAGSTTVTKKDYITVTLPVTKPVAAFTADKTSGKKPLTVTFKYTGTGGTPDTYNWNFGDGTNSQQAVTATHTFAKAGTYTVSVTSKNAAGSSTATKTKYITVK